MEYYRIKSFRTGLELVDLKANVVRISVLAKLRMRKQNNRREVPLPLPLASVEISCFLFCFCLFVCLLRMYYVDLVRMQP